VSALRVIGVDPGFANIGLCVIDVFPVGCPILVATKLIVTKPGKGKGGNQDDEKRRLEVIEDAIIAFLDEHEPDVLAMEEPGRGLMRRKRCRCRGGGMEWVSNPATVRTSCLMWGSVHGVCRDRGIYCVKVGSQEIKKTLCDRKNASKADVIAEVKSRFPAYKNWPTTKKIEHVADAVGAAVTSFTYPAIMVMLRKLRTGT